MARCCSNVALLLLIVAKMLLDVAQTLLNVLLLLLDSSIKKIRACLFLVLQVGRQLKNMN